MSLHESLERIDGLIDLRRLDVAEQALSQLLRDYPDAPQAQVVLGRLRLAQGDQRAAEAALETALSQLPDDIDARYFLFKVACNLDQVARAELLILGLLHDLPEHALFYAEYAEMCLDHLQLEKADGLAAEAVRLAPGLSRVRAVSAIVFSVTRDDPESQALAARHFADDPESFVAGRVLLQRLLVERRYKDAWPLAQQLMRARPGDEALAAVVVELRLATGWVGWLFAPTTRWGWAGSAGIWGGFVALLIVLPALDRDDWVFPASMVYLGWALASWTVPSVARRWYRRHGV